MLNKEYGKTGSFMMNKINVIFIGCVFFLLASSMISCAGESLIIATDDWPPYEYREGTKIVGFSTEVVEAVLKDMDVHIAKIRVYPWARAEKLAFIGDVDMIFSASKSDKRMEFCHFPDEPLIISPNVLFIRKSDIGRLRFDSFSDLKGHRVGIVRDYAYTREFLDYLDAEKIKTLTALDDVMNFKFLMKGMVDYIPADLGNSRGIIKKLDINGQVYAFRGNPLKTAGLYALFSKKRIDITFVEKFSAHLKKFKATPSYQEIYDKYFGMD